MNRDICNRGGGQVGDSHGFAACAKDCGPFVSEGDALRRTLLATALQTMCVIENQYHTRARSALSTYLTFFHRFQLIFDLAVRVSEARVEKRSQVETIVIGRIYANISITSSKIFCASVSEHTCFSVICWCLYTSSAPLLSSGE